MLFLSCIAAFVYIISMGPLNGMPEDGVFLPVDVPTQHLMDGGSTLVVPSQGEMTPAVFLCKATQCVAFFPCIILAGIAKGIETGCSVSAIMGICGDD